MSSRNGIVTISLTNWRGPRPIIDCKKFGKNRMQLNDWPVAGAVQMTVGFWYFVGTIVLCPYHLWSVVLLHCDYYCPKSHIWCHHWYVCWPQKWKAAERGDSKEYMLHMRYVLCGPLYAFLYRYHHQQLWLSRDGSEHKYTLISRREMYYDLFLPSFLLEYYLITKSTPNKHRFFPSLTDSSKHTMY